MIPRLNSFLAECKRPGARRLPLCNYGMGDVVLGQVVIVVGSGNSARSEVNSLGELEGGEMEGLSDDEDANTPAMVNWVVLSTRALLLRSTERWKWWRKSSLRIGLLTSATTKIQGRERLRPSEGLPSICGNA